MWLTLLTLNGRKDCKERPQLLFFSVVYWPPTVLSIILIIEIEVKTWIVDCNLFLSWWFSSRHLSLLCEVIHATDQHFLMSTEKPIVTVYTRNRFFWGINFSFLLDDKFFFYDESLRNAINTSFIHQGTKKVLVVASGKNLVCGYFRAHL